MKFFSHTYGQKEAVMGYAITIDPRETYGGYPIRATLYPSCAPSKVLLILAYGATVGFHRGVRGWRFAAEALRYFYPINVMTFDYANMELENRQELFYHSSLNTRLWNTRGVIQYAFREFPDHSIIVGGHSAGAAIAARLLGEKHFSENISGAVLSAPAAYHPDAWHESFGPEFRRIIRQENSWHSSLEFSHFLEGGDLSMLKMVISCEGDSVVKPEIWRNYLPSEANDQADVIHHEIDRSPLGHRVFRHPRRVKQYVRFVGSEVMAYHRNIVSCQRPGAAVVV